jgi:hypothetical protein
MNWDLFFDELSFLDDVHFILLRELQLSGLVIKELCISVSMVLAIQLSALLPWLNKSNTLELWSPLILKDMDIPRRLKILRTSPLKHWSMKPSKCSNS